MLPTRFWEIGLGSLAYFFSIKNLSVKNKSALITNIFSSILIIFILIVIIFFSDYPVLATISIVTLTAFSLFLIEDSTRIGKIFSLPYLRHIGTLSYSLYLWHWGVLSISRITIGIHWWSIPLQLISIYFLALASYFYIETPLRLLRLFDNKLKNIFFIIISLISSTFIIIPTYIGRKYIYLGNQPLSIYPTLYSGEIIREICMKNNLINPNSFLKDCLFSKDKNSNTIFIAGDSHAEALTYSFSKLADKLNYDLHLFYRGGIIFPNIDMLTLSKINKKKLSNKASIEYAKHIENHGKPGDILFISLRYHCYFGFDWNQCPTDNFAIFTNSLNKIKSKKDLLNKWILEINTFAKKMQSKGIKIILTSPTPEFPQGNNSRCLGQDQQWFNRLNKVECETNIKFFKGNYGIYKEINQSLKKLISNNSNIYLFDLFEALCNEEICDYSDEDMNALYTDSHHLSNFANRVRVFPKLYKFMIDNIKPKNNF